MNGRELVILLLGLAIVAVVLRGLYVAINARRGQIKLAIDKNIPQNVDLESLELAELPGGGARVVTRSLEEVNRQNNALDLAENKAKTLNLADAEEDDHIPVLMDAVELAEPDTANVLPTQEFQREDIVPEDLTAESSYSEMPVAEEVDIYAADPPTEDVEDEFRPEEIQQHSIGDNWDEDEIETDITDGFSDPVTDQVTSHDSERFEDDVNEFNAGDSVDVADSMNSIAPDYEAEAEGIEEVEMHHHAESAEGDVYANDEGYQTSGESDFEDEIVEENAAEEFGEQDVTQEYEQEEQTAVFDADSSADAFSMTAGERIGVNTPAIDEAKQSSLFDDIEEPAEESRDKPKSGRSLFSLFGRKSKQVKESPEEEQQTVAVTDSAEQETAAVDEPIDVLLEENFVQVDIEEVEHEEPTYVDHAIEEPQVAEEIVDELDQKRAASFDQEPQGQDSQSEEFEHSEVLVLNVTAKDGRVFSGDDLLQILITSGLKFGDMNIFHKRLSKEHQGTVIFSVANMLNPGTFDLNNMDEFTTLGISFFLALPTAINNLDAFEQMLGVAQDIRDTLGGDLKDDHRNGMTGQTIEHYRQRIRDFELRRLKAVAARG